MVSFYTLIKKKLSPAYGDFLTKHSYFSTLTRSRKKNTTEKLKISRETTSGFKKTDFQFGETTFGFTLVQLFSKSAVFSRFEQLK